jgi:hypothetical protein
MTTATDRSTFEQPLGPGGLLKVRLPVGEIAATGTDGDQVRVRELDGRPLDDLFRIESSADRLELLAPDRFSLDQIFSFASGRRFRGRIAIELPRGATVEIEGASATIVLTGLTGRTRIRTASGDINLADMAGDLQVDSASGRVRIAAGDDIALRVRTISADVSVSAPRLTRLEAGTTSGDIKLDAALGGPGPWSIDTVSGDARLVGRSGLTIRGRTVTGDVRSDLPHRSETSGGARLLIVGDGATPLAFSSVSGDLRVVQARPVSASALAATTTDRAPADGPARSFRPVAAIGADDDARMAVLRALERGEIDVTEAADRLAALEG